MGIVGCFKATLSKVLGMGIIGGSLLVKIPQIVKILRNKSGEGINIFSVLLDLFAITTMVSYSFINGFPFSAWGDGVFLGLQTLAIAVLVMHYNGETAKAIASLFAYVAVVFAANSGATPIYILLACQAINIPIVLISKLMQAWTNYSNGNTGQLSAATIFMLFFGSLARIFTSIQETNDATMITMYVCSTLANGIIVVQLFYYWNVDVKSKVKSKKKL
ncbi:mannose-P-dolichol utilization defect 1 protein homolog isoform X2 [Odontomachus brunneus]|uniref:mannose-P-dolichol utilization defect 1 protein homolog isoform X2 n=1 Tax=Odontomachus brunneus TaxID=486640 RepID=UPI0013F229F4|nr:mannose-P-dolichol utilization defect 1 protein homolog isoform X2 [Odontomachus brunneus]XP_032689410.1 mannose-P-dolichol utilization defect 1 protein homolog isoform X2 [Odontomachus brunneus]